MEYYYNEIYIFSTSKLSSRMGQIIFKLQVIEDLSFNFFKDKKYSAKG